MPDDWSQFWAMGGYAKYVWSSYAIAAVVVIGNVLSPWIAHRRLLRRLRNEDIDD